MLCNGSGDNNIERQFQVVDLSFVMKTDLADESFFELLMNEKPSEKDFRHLC